MGPTEGWGGTPGAMGGDQVAAPSREKGRRKLVIRPSAR